VVLRDERGVPGRAIITDYKSNRISRAAEFERAIRVYRPQLELYRRALAAILGLAEARIGLQILFTRAGRVCEV
jgi:ATP-dependent exoDNAse (exonuclease V) beta subunit